MPSCFRKRSGGVWEAGEQLEIHLDKYMEIEQLPPLRFLRQLLDCPLPGDAPGFNTYIYIFHLFPKLYLYITCSMNYAFSQNSFAKSKGDGDHVRG